MRLAPGLLAVALSTASLTGCCHHNCYNPAMSPCAPTAAAQGPVVRYGDVCQVPAGGTTPMITTTPSGRSAISDAPAPRVVVSEPGRSSGLKGWRKADPEGLARTTVEGGLSNESLNR